MALRPVDDPKRIRIDDQIALGVLGDVEELKRLGRGRPEDHRGSLVVQRAVAGAVEAVLGVAPGHRATEMGALPVRGDDPARRVKQEEAALAEEDRTVVRRRETIEELVPCPDRDRDAEALDTVHANEGSDERAELGRGQAERPEEAQSEERPAPPA